MAKTKTTDKAEKIEKTVEPTTTPKKGFIAGTGRRKTAVAKVFMYKEKGDFIVNGKDIDAYFTLEQQKIKWLRPFHAIGVSHPATTFSASIKVFGSSIPSQLDAVIHGISRALSEIDPEYSLILRKQGFLTRDSRMVERKKPFLRKARKAPQYSKR